MKKLLSLLGLLRNKKEGIIPNTDNVIQGLQPSVTADLEAIEVFVNSDKDKFAELYYKNGGYTYMINEKHCDDFEGKVYYYWCPDSLQHRQWICFRQPMILTALSRPVLRRCVCCQEKIRDKKSNFKRNLSKGCLHEKYYYQC